MKTYKVSCRKVKISISLRAGNFQFSARGEKYVYLKKTHPGLKFHPGVNFASPTCNMPLKNENFFERETLNPNNEKYLVKIIGYKL